MKKELRLDLVKGIQRLKVTTQSLVNTKFVGGYRSVFRGRGLEFEDYRDYSGSDDASLIDWKASVRSNKLLIKQFTEERNLNVFFLIDVSSSMVYSSFDKLKIEYAGEIIAAISFMVLNSGDSIGYALFNDHIIKSAPPTRGMAQYHDIVKTLVNPKNYGGKYDLSNALKHSLAFLKEFSIVILLSDFIGLDKNWEHYLKMVSKKYDLIGIMIRDPRDKSLPESDSQVVLQDPYSGKEIIVRPNTLNEKYKKFVQKQEQYIKDSFQKADADFMQLSTDKSFIEPLTKLFMRRASRHR